jgi:hypothetical protein
MTQVIIFVQIVLTAIHRQYASIDVISDTQIAVNGATPNVADAETQLAMVITQEGDALTVEVKDTEYTDELKVYENATLLKLHELLTDYQHIFDKA